jgi:hypothetical protein
MEPLLVKLTCQELLHAIANPGATGNSMDTTSAYFGRRFCTSCCREWGDYDVLLDLLSTHYRQPRTTAYMNLGRDLGVTLHACCTRAVVTPVQHDIADYIKHAIIAVSSTLGEGAPSSFRLISKRARLTIDGAPRSKTATQLTQIITMTGIEAILS